MATVRDDLAMSASELREFLSEQPLAAPVKLNISGSILFALDVRMGDDNGPVAHITADTHGPALSVAGLLAGLADADALAAVELGPGRADAAGWCSAQTADGAPVVLLTA